MSMKRSRVEYCCDMRGMLSFLILWLLTKKPMNGSEIANELQKRRGIRPNPGTIYPAIKQLESRNLITSEKRGRMKIYHITDRGKAGFEVACDFFCNCFRDIFTERTPRRSK
ncbi:MAG: PadR family transcriptional regulator [archaeon]|nr:PadR family transcriptional regulator [archaeon]MCP8319868.1 PadR family transcriptional regulator [archaeon]